VSFVELTGISFVNTTVGLLVGGDDILYTVDGGTSWVQQGGLYSPWNGLRAVALLDEDTAVIVGAGGTILRSTNLQESLDL
jgi:photosystem II stability/assembly factor-like uncharacterized protein